MRGNEMTFKTIAISQQKYRGDISISVLKKKASADGFLQVCIKA
jgi:hypothetical protein